METSQKHIAQASSTIVSTIIVGALFYHLHEGMDWLNAFYPTVMTVMTIGSNYTPKDDLSKWFTMIYMLVSVPTLLFCLSLVVEDRFESKLEHKSEIKEKIHERREE